MATESIVGGLFGMTPEAYQLQQSRQDLARAAELGQMDPFASARTSLIYGGSQLGRGLQSMMGVEDPQLQKIAAFNQVAQNIDYSDLKSISEGVKSLSKVDPQSAMRLQTYAADLYQKMQPQKLTGDERYIQTLKIAENFARSGKELPPELLSEANIAAQMLSKPRSFFDQASGQTVTIPATDPSKAFPNVFKQFGVSTTTTGEALRPSAPTTGVTTTEQVTAGNLPSGSQKRLGEINANITKIEQSGPELNEFIDLIKTGKVKYDATSNTIDFLGSVVPPAFGMQEFGSQVDKDKIDRALTDRVNTLLLMAKGTQTEGDADRAKQQIASYSTKFSPARMQSAIESLIKAENKLKNELGAEKETLLGQGRSAGGATQQAAPKSPPQPSASGDEAKIQRYIDFNKGKPTREQAINALKSAGLIKGQ